MEYSAVTQPRPALRSQPGTPCSTVAQVSTRVLPSETSTEPSAVWTKPGVRTSGRSWTGVLPPGRKKEEDSGPCIEGLYGNRPRGQPRPARKSSRFQDGKTALSLTRNRNSFVTY